ncbi:MAG: ABC transporter ATP-binding protein [Planctomycetota bacterium]
MVGVEKRFANGTLALQSLNLGIDRGSFNCFVGPSGCGKSTALRIIAGLTSVTSGEVHWSGSAIRNGQHEVGFVFQEPTLMPWRRVRDNVRLPLQLRGVSRADSKDAVDEALELVGLADFARAYPRELSGGMKMRVSIARALVTKPDILLMDEPFAALDEMTRFKLNDDLLRLWQERRWTVVFVTHSVYESVYLANRVVVMAPRPGRVVDLVQVDAPHPRDDSFRRSSEYADCCSRVSRSLAESMPEGIK